MPQPCFHLQLAETVLKHWRESPTQSPIPITERSRLAFLHGSLGPDIGFFPSTPRILSVLAHSTRTGELTRALLRYAHDEAQVAFALGWATHILADAIVHPIVNRFVDDLLACVPLVTRAAQYHLHIRLEIGIDLLVHRRHRELRMLRLPAVFRQSDLHFLSRGFAEIHDVTATPDMLAAGHRRVALLTGPLLALQATMSACVPPVTAPVPFVRSVQIGLGTLQNMAAYLGGRDNSTVAFLSPVYPPDSFVTELDRAVARFHKEFERQVKYGLALLPNLNLDTGEIETTEARTAITAVA